MTFSKDVSFFDSQPMFICDQPTLRILDLNKAAENVLGYEKDELLKKKILDIASLTTKKRASIFFQNTDEHDDEKLWEIKTKNGKTLYFQISANLISFKGKPAKLVVAHNVTNEVTNTLRKNVLSRPLSIHNFPLAEIEWDPKLNIVRWSDKAEELFGWSEKEAVESDRLLVNFIHPDDLEFVREELHRSYSNQDNQVSVINRNITKDGRIIYCEWYNSILYDDQGEVISIYSMAHNVTDREEAMMYSRRGMKSYQDLFDSISDAIYLLNYKGEIIEANRGLVHTFGYNREEVVGKHQSILAAPGKYDERRLKEITRFAREGTPIKKSGWGKKKNGEVFPTEFLANAGNYFGEDVIIIIERNVSDRKEYEDALKRREELFSRLFNSAPIGIALLNKHKEVELVNEGFEHMFGWREEELKGLELDKFIVPEMRTEEAARLSESDKVLQVTEKRIRKDGRLLDVILYVIPVIVGSQIVGIYGIYVDITERQKVEAQIKKSLKEKEVLLAEIHHRVKNNLAVITGLLELQSYSVAHNNTKRILQDSQMRVNSIALVHEKLYQGEDFSELDIAQYFKELTDEIHRSLSIEGLEVEIEMNIEDVHLPITQAIPSGLLINEIITNSFKHAFKGRAKGKITISFYHAENDCLVLEIGDDGIGMKENHNANVNNSLGMTLIKTLARQLNAEYSYSGKAGMHFRFRFEREQ